MVLDLFKNFNIVKYDDIPHKYYIDNKQLISVTTLIGNYKDEFDELYWSEIKAKQFGIHQWEVREIWRFINRKATLKGSLVHNYAENLFGNKILAYDKKMVIQTLGYDCIYDEYLIQKGQVDKFYKDSFNKLIPIKTELVICDINIGIGGMIDLLVWNVKEKEYQLWDYKTNKEFTYESDRNLTGILYNLNDSDINIYSLQLSLYKELIERNTNIKIGKCYLVWLSHLEKKYEIIKTEDYSYYANLMIKDYLKNYN